VIDSSVGDFNRLAHPEDTACSVHPVAGHTPSPGDKGVATESLGGAAASAEEGDRAVDGMRELSMREAAFGARPDLPVTALPGQPAQRWLAGVPQDTERDRACSVLAGARRDATTLGTGRMPA
jgi:hypothetical protein